MKPPPVEHTTCCRQRGLEERRRLNGLAETGDTTAARAARRLSLGLREWCPILGLLEIWDLHVQLIVDTEHPCQVVLIASLGATMCRSGRSGSGFDISHDGSLHGLFTQTHQRDVGTSLSTDINKEVPTILQYTSVVTNVTILLGEPSSLQD